MIAELIALTAILYTLLSFYIQRKMSNIKKVYEMQEQIKSKSKELNEMVKRGASNDELLAKQKEVMSLASKSMMSQMKPMVIILPLFLIVYYLLLPILFPSHPMVYLGGAKFAYNTFFIIVVFIFGLLLSITVTVRDRRIAKKSNIGKNASNKENNVEIEKSNPINSPK